MESKTDNTRLSQLIDDKNYPLAIFLVEKAYENNNDTLLNLGKTYHLCGQSYRALRVLKSLPENDQNVQEHVAMILAEIGDKNNALIQFQKILQQFPDSVLALVNAASMIMNDNAQLAESWLQKAFSLSPNERHVTYNLGLLYQAKMNWQEAYKYFQQTLDHFPNDQAAMVGCARALINFKKFSKAQQLINTLSNMRDQCEIPAVNITELHASLANHQHGPKQGLDILQQWFQNPKNAQKASTLVNAAFYAYEIGEYSLSYEYCQKILLVKPEHPEANLGLSQTLLLRKQFAEGFRTYEYRAKLPRYLQNLSLPQIPLDNENPLSKDDTLLVNPDQGEGDYFMFLRFIPQMAEQVKRVDIATSDSKKKLIEHFTKKYNNINIINEFNTQNAIPWTRQCRITSLGRLNKVETEKDIPFTEGYLSSPVKSKPKWLKKTTNKTHKNFGIVWRGNPLHKNDRLRSIKLEKLTPLWGIPNTQWYSLQHQTNEEEHDIWPKELYNASSHIKNFSDLAKIMHHLDAVITIDSAPLHLAGAMGIPTHGLITHVPDWRWGEETQSSYWYDSVRLWRQTKRGDWKTVLNRLTTFLNKS